MPALESSQIDVLRWRDKAPSASGDAEICLVDPNTRQGKRTPVTLKIKFKSETLEQFIERYAVDVSQGGIFIRTKEPLAVGTQMKFEFQLRDASPLIAGEGTVVWTRENDPSRPAIAPGMGVRFDRLADGSQSILERILAEKAKQAPQRPAVDTTKPPLFTDTPTRVAPAPMQDALLGKDNGRSRRTSDDSAGSDSHTPLPKPMPFHSDADEFPDEAFEEATKVRALDELIAQTAEGTGGDELALRRPNGRSDVSQSDPSERAATLTESAEASQLRRDRAHPTTGKVAVSRALSDGFEAPDLPHPPEQTTRLLAKALEGAPPLRNEPGQPAFVPESLTRTRPGVEPARGRVSTPPVGSPLADPAFAGLPMGFRSVASDQTEPARMAVKPRSNSPILILILLIVAVAGAAVWFFVLRPRATEPAVESAAVPKPPEGAAATPGSAAVAVPATGSAAGSDTTAAAAAASNAPPAQLVDTVIGSSAEGARIEIKGTEQSGGAPFAAKLEKGKSYKVRVTAHGYATLELDIKGGDDKPIAKLVAKPRVISIASDPPGALILVDSVATGRTTPSDVELTPAQGLKKTVRLQLRKSGYKSVERVVEIGKLDEDDTKMSTAFSEKLTVQPPTTPAPRPTPTAPKDPAGSAADGPVTEPAAPVTTPSQDPPAPAKEPAPAQVAPTPAAPAAAGSGEPEPDFNKPK